MTTPPLKLLLVGDSGTGKSSLLLRFTEDRFLGEDVHMATIGVDFKVKRVDVDGRRIKLTIWDTAGQERFRTLTASYYRGAHGIIIVYVVNSRESFDDVRNIWLRELTNYADLKRSIVMVVGNKTDKKERQVSVAEGQQLARDLQALFMEASAKTKVGVQAAFEELVRKVLDTPVVLEANEGLHKRRSDRISFEEREEPHANNAKCAC